jgi:hypothetical protein
MRQFSEQGRGALNEIAGRYGVSFDAAEHLLMAVIAGHTTQAQFNHPELGGMGQWSQGGMTMVGDMFNNSLKAKVDGLCNELANLARGADGLWQSAPMRSQSQSSFQSQGNGGVSLFRQGAFSSGNWWPDELGFAGSTGAQNDLRYAFFPTTHRLAINAGGRVTLYDTRDHQIGGFSQQQSGDQSLSFTSQYGLVDLASLDVVTLPGPDSVAPTTYKDEAPSSFADQVDAATFDQPQPVQAVHSPKPDEDIFAKIEKLASLYEKGILTDEEYKSKKAELLSRL